MTDHLLALEGLSASGYTRSHLHADDLLWTEKNCYVDIWIEVLNALKLAPEPVMGSTIALDFEGDQWTFFKPSHGELYDLYGVDVQELTVWRPLLDHCIEHLKTGKFISTESNAFWLPDTAGTDYRQNHVKTTIVLAEVDVAGERAGYFHNAGYFEMRGEDFRQTFRVGMPHDPSFLPLFAETIRFDRQRTRGAAELAVLARPLWQKHLARVPSTNPVERFTQRFEHDAGELVQQGLPHYHAWAFATIRQLGASFELAALSLRWQRAHDPLGSDALLDAAQRFEHMSGLTKSLILKLARAVNGKKRPDVGAVMLEMTQSWQQGMDALRQALG